jgi:integron integrase
VRHLSLKTEKAYLHWIRRFILFHGKRHPQQMGETEVNAFLTYLAVKRKVSPSTQTQALCALVYLYKIVLEKELGELKGLIRAPKRRRLPMVLTRDEVKVVFAGLTGEMHLLLSLLYGTGMRLSEGLRLRVKDVDLDQNQITVRDGKGAKDRMTVLPESLKKPLLSHLRQVKQIHDRDLKDGEGRTNLPYALARKYPGAATQWGWQYVFPAAGISRDPRTGNFHRHHIHERNVQRAFAEAVRRSGIAKPATVHTLRHSFATHLLVANYDIRTVQELLGHRSVKTTMIYTHVLNRGGRGIQSPVDTL